MTSYYVNFWSAGPTWSFFLCPWIRVLTLPKNYVNGLVMGWHEPVIAFQLYFSIILSLGPICLRRMVCKYNYNNGLFSSGISLLFLQSRGIKLKMHSCVISDLLCTKYEAPKLVSMLRALCVKKNVICDVSFPSTSLYNTTNCWKAVFYTWLQSYALATSSSAPKAIKWRTNPPTHFVYWTYKTTGDELIQIHSYAYEGTVATLSPAENFGVIKISEN